MVRKRRTRQPRVNVTHARGARPVLDVAVPSILKWEVGLREHDDTADITWFSPAPARQHLESFLKRLSEEQGNRATTKKTTSKSSSKNKIQWVNRFPGMEDCAAKAGTMALIKRMQRLFPDEYDFFPRSWDLGDEAELAAWTARCEEAMGNKTQNPPKKTRGDEPPVYIVKPDMGSQGDGIYLVHGPKGLRRSYLGSDEVIVQEYLDRPLLVDGYKFDLRVYAMLYGVGDVPKVCVFREGLARFCTEKYQPPTGKNMSKTYMHLTNYSLNKMSADFVKADGLNDAGASKRYISSVFSKLEAAGVLDSDEVWTQMDDMIAKTVAAMSVPLASALVERKVDPNGTCFQVLGFDVFLDEDCKPWLLEVNGNPSLSIMGEIETRPGVFEEVPSALDEDIKSRCVAAFMCKLLNRHKQLRRLQDKNNNNSSNNNSSSSSDDEDDEDDDDDDDDSEDDEDDGQDGEVSSVASAAPTDSNPPPASPTVVTDCNMAAYADLLVLHSMRRVFEHYCGVRGKGLMSATKWSQFVRTSGLAGSQVQRADADIMFRKVVGKSTPLCVGGTTLGMDCLTFSDACVRMYLQQHPDEHGTAPDAVLTKCIAMLAAKVPK